MANPKLATTDYVNGEVAKRQEYFADVSVNEVTGNRELSLKDADGSVAGQIIAQKEGSVLFKKVATPNEATDGANKEYVDDNFANALKGSASGKVVKLTDVSPIEHTLGAKVSSKNLIPFYNRHGTATESGITYTIDDLIITANGTVTGNQSQYFLFNGQDITTGVLNVNPAETFYISGCPEGGSTSTYYLGVLLYKDTTNVAMFNETGNGFLLYQPDADYNRVLFKIYIAKGTTVNNLVFKPQMERGSAATPFAPYLPDVTTVTVTRYGAVETDSPQTYTPAVDGTVSGVKSLYPTTTLTTNNSGAIINAEYNRDINKAFAALEAAIATNNS